MKEETQHLIIDKILNSYKQRISDVAPESSSIPVSHYTSEKRYLEECNALFRERTPLIIGRSAEVPSEGDFITHLETPVPVLAVRGKDGKLRAFINVCRHRGTMLVGAASGKSKKSFACPYHSWTYNLHGELIAIPHEYGFNDRDKKCLGLAELPVQELFGFIWCIPGGKEPFNIREYLGQEICDDFKSYNIDADIVYDVREAERAINWKLTMDTFLENYHVKHAHRTTIDSFFLDNISVTDPMGKHVRIVFPKKTILELENIPRADFPDIRKHANVLYSLFPNTLVLMEPDHISVSHVYPKKIDATKVVSYTLLKEPPASEKAIAYWKKNNDILYGALEEDFNMAKLVQQGLLSGANESLIHGRFEKGLKFFHHSIDQALSD